MNLVTSMVMAQDMWKLNSSLNVMSGSYKDSLTMKNQHGIGLKITGEYDEQWGITAGAHSTSINMAPITQIATQNQDNWLISGYFQFPSIQLLGRWKMQLDGHHIHNDARQGNTSEVKTIAPQVSWISQDSSLKIDANYASSAYKNSHSVHQFGYGFGIGFNNQKNWLQIHQYLINNLDTTNSLGQTSTVGGDIQITQFLSNQIGWIPNSVTLGLERGRKIFAVDMSTQSVYNLPMINEGGENIVLSWKLNQTSNLNIQASETKYYSEAIQQHKFKLKNLNAQISKYW